MYLKTPLDQYEYMQMLLKLFPDDIIDHYNLHEKALNGYVYMEIWRGMSGLPQAGILANKLLCQHLGQHGYFEVQHTPSLWKHLSRPIWFNLICAPTTLVSNTLVMRISSTSFVHYALKHTKLLTIGLAISTAVLISSGNMTNVRLTLPCPSMQSRTSPVTTICHR